jgi:hypothetical protein
VMFAREAAAFGRGRLCAARKKDKASASGRIDKAG